VGVLDGVAVLQDAFGVIEQLLGGRHGERMIASGPDTLVSAGDRLSRVLVSSTGDSCHDPRKSLTSRTTEEQALLLGRAVGRSAALVNLQKTSVVCAGGPGLTSVSTAGGCGGTTLRLLQGAVTAAGDPLACDTDSANPTCVTLTASRPVGSQPMITGSVDIPYRTTPTTQQQPPGARAGRAVRHGSRSPIVVLPIIGSFMAIRRRRTGSSAL
jgi:hypothetical protein